MAPLDTTANVLTFVGILVLAVSTAYFDTPAPVTKKQLLRALQHEAVVGRRNRADDGSGPPRVAIGYNGNIDLVVSATAALEAAGVGPVPVPSADSGGRCDGGDDGTADAPCARDHDAIATRRDLAEVFQHFFDSGGAGERTVTDAALFDDLVAAAAGVKEARYSPGGNAALMAMQLQRDGCDVLLGSKVGPTLRGLIGDGIAPASPLADKDETHLILEYANGDGWGGSTASRANRFIVSNDEFNARLRSLEDLQAAMPNFGPEVVVVAGVHLLEAQGTDVYEARLNDVAMDIRNTVYQFPEARVHVEVGSMADSTFIARMCDTILPLVDSVGMNEQEMGDMYAALGGALSGDGLDAGAGKGGQAGGAEAPSAADISGKVPSPRGVAVTVRHLLRRYPNLSRVHFHSLAFHILAEHRTERSLIWGRAGAAAAAAATTATLRACNATEPELHGNDLDMLLPLRFSVHDPEAPVPASTGGNSDADASAKGKLKGADVRKLDGEQPVARWTWRMASKDGAEPAAADAARGTTVAFKLAPVLVCKKPVQTVGLGDAISASGLAMHAHPSRV